MFVNLKRIGHYLPCQPETVSDSFKNVNRSCEQFKVIPHEVQSGPLPRLNKQARAVFEEMKRLAQRCDWGLFVYGCYEKIAKLLNKRLRKKVSEEYLRKLVAYLTSVGLMEKIRKVYYDRWDHKFSHGYLNLIPNFWAKYRHTRREKGFRIYEGDLERWGLTKAGTYVRKSQTNLIDHIEPHVGTGEMFNRTDASFLTKVCDFMHSKNALKDSNGVRWVTFSRDSYSRMVDRHVSSVDRSSRKFLDLGVFSKETIRNSKGVDCVKITINFTRLAEVCNDPEIMLLDPFIKEKTNLRLICGKLRGQLEVSSANDLAGLRENDSPKLSEHRHKILYTSYNEKHSENIKYIKNKKNITSNIFLSIREEDNSCVVRSKDQQVRFEESDSDPNTEQTYNKPSRIEVFERSNEALNDLIHPEIKGIEAPEKIKGWFGVDNSFVVSPPNNMRYSEFDKEVFVNYVAEQIYGDEGTVCCEAVEGFFVPDSRLERAWLSINFGLYALMFLGKENFKCGRVANNVFAVEFASGDERRDLCAGAALEKLHPNAKLISRDKFIDSFRRRVNGQLLEKWAPKSVLAKVTAWLQRDPWEVELEQFYANALWAEAERETKEQKERVKRMEKENAHYEKRRTKTHQ